MKKIIVILAVISLTSCTKDWVCKIESTSNNNTNEYYVDFRGTTEEKNSYEDENTFSSSGLMDIDIVTTCVPD